MSTIELDDIAVSRMQIIRLYKLSILLFIFAFCTAIFNLYNCYGLFKVYKTLPDFVGSTFKAKHIASIIFLFLYGILVPIQAYFFFQFAIKLKESIVVPLKNTDALNWASKQTIIGILLFGINTIWAIIDVFILT